MASKTTKNPILLQKEHFTKDLKTGMPVEFYKEFYLLLLIYKSVKESYLVFVETLPNEVCKGRITGRVYLLLIMSGDGSR